MTKVQRNGEIRVANNNEAEKCSEYDPVYRLCKYKMTIIERCDCSICPKKKEAV
jgi:hypothetical protein